MKWRVFFLLNPNRLYRFENLIWLLTIWTFPNTLLGLAIGYLGVFSGGKVQRVDGCWEFHGGIVTRLLRFAPTGSGAMAMTLGHTILGQTQAALDIARAHEHVHVRQYEKFGPFFIPAYFAASFYAWVNRKDAYRDNIFEVEAFDKEPINRRSED